MTACDFLALHDGTDTSEKSGGSNKNFDTNIPPKSEIRS